jgi:hypothetical protein
MHMTRHPPHPSPTPWRHRLIGLVLAIMWLVVGAEHGHAAPRIVPTQLVSEPDVLDFGSVEVDADRTQALVVRNVDGEGPLTVTEVAVIFGPFVVVDDGCTGRELDNGDTCTIDVRFEPTSTGVHAGTLGVQSDAGLVGIDLSGEGILGSEPEPTTSTSTSLPPVIGTTSTTSTTVPTSDEELLDACDERARDAQVQFPAELTLTVGDEHPFTVAASVAGFDTTTPSPTTGTPTTVVPVALRCEVAALLRGGQAVDVRPDEPLRGSFLDRDTVRWTWFVTPRQPGTRILTLEIVSVAVIGGREIIGVGGELFETEVRVRAASRSIPERAGGIIGAVFPNGVIRDLASLIAVLGALAAAWRWLLKRPWPWRGTDDADGSDELVGADEPGAGAPST